jgi:hypothetical protein
MGAEQKSSTMLNKTLNSAKQSSSELRDKALYIAVRAASPSIRLAQERIARSTSVEFVDGFWNAYGDFREDDYFPIDEANHGVQQNADSLALAVEEQVKFERYLQLPEEKRLKGFILPLADTLNSGSHGAAIQAIYHADRKFLARHSMYPLHLARRVDVTQGKTQPNLIAFYKKLLKGFNNGYSVAVFPEGNTTGGKRVHEEKNADGTTIWVPNPNNELNGMHAFERDSQALIISAARKAGRKTMIIPIGIAGGTNIQDPMTKLPTRTAYRVSFGLESKKKILVRVRVGMPLPTDQGELGELIKAGDVIGANSLVERHIAGLLPPNHRGIHKEDFISPGGFWTRQEHLETYIWQIFYWYMEFPKDY